MTRKRRKRNTSHRSRRRRTALSAAPRRRRSRNAHRAAPRRRRRNQTRIVIRRNSRRRRRNPFSSEIKSVFGGLLGVTGTKLIPAALPGNLTGTPIMASLTSVAAAWGVGEIVKRILGPDLGRAYQFGGYMQAGSVILNAFVPAIGGQLSLKGMRGLGELVSAAYPIPQNPLNPMQANYPLYGKAAVGPADNGVTPSMNGLARAFPVAF